MSLKKELGLNELIILSNITFDVNTIFNLIILVRHNLLSDMIQRCSLYRDRKGWSYYNCKPQRLKKQNNTLLSNDELFEGYTS